MPDSLDDLVAQAMRTCVRELNATRTWTVEDELEAGYRKLAAAVRAAIDASGTHAVVPLEPTDLMIDVVDTEDNRLPLVNDEICKLYHAMLAARPRK